MDIKMDVCMETKMDGDKRWMDVWWNDGWISLYRSIERLR